MSKIILPPEHNDGPGDALMGLAIFLVLIIIIVLAVSKYATP